MVVLPYGKSTLDLSCYLFPQRGVVRRVDPRLPKLAEEHMYDAMLALALSGDVNLNSRDRCGICLCNFALKLSSPSTGCFTLIANFAGLVRICTAPTNKYLPNLKSFHLYLVWPNFNFFAQMGKVRTLL